MKKQERSQRSAYDTDAAEKHQQRTSNRFQLLAVSAGAGDGSRPESHCGSRISQLGADSSQDHGWEHYKGSASGYRVECSPNHGREKE